MTNSTRAHTDSVVLIRYARVQCSDAVMEDVVNDAAQSPGVFPLQVRWHAYIKDFP